MNKLGTWCAVTHRISASAAIARLPCWYAVHRRAAAGQRLLNALVLPIISPLHRVRVRGRAGGGSNVPW